jgi:hypothetical protein
VPEADAPPEPETTEPDPTPAPPSPSFLKDSVAWLLRQPYGADCDDGARAGDNIGPQFVPHPASGRCTFVCGGFAQLCADVAGESDGQGFCVPVAR